MTEELWYAPRLSEMFDPKRADAMAANSAEPRQGLRMTVRNRNHAGITGKLR